MPAPPIVMSPPANASVGVASTPILAANARRRYAIFVNDSANDIYLAFGADAVLNKGERLGKSGGVYEMLEGLNLSRQAVNGICAVAAQNVTVQEGI